MHRVKIEDDSRVWLRFDKVHFVRRLLETLPASDLVGLERVVLSDHVTSNRGLRRKAALGVYKRASRDGPAAIELALEDALRGAGPCVRLLPLVPKLLIADALFHEVAHHWLATTSRKHHSGDSEEEARRYSKMAMARAFTTLRALQFVGGAWRRRGE